jgi:carbonic anhydrase
MAHIDPLLERNKHFATTAVVIPEQTVRADVELLRSATILPATITVSGHVYDVTTGLVTTVLPAAPMYTSASYPAGATSEGH